MMNINERQIQKLMGRMGISQEEIDADEVVIRTKEKELIISSPHVTKVRMGGQDTFQVIGEVSERKKGFSEDDMNIIMEQTGASREDAEKALQEEGDLAKAILKLKQ